LQRVRFALALLGVGAAGVVAAYAIPASGSSSAVAATVAVKGTDVSARVSPTTITANRTYIFKVTNCGRKTHAFVIKGKKIKVKAHRTISAKIAFGFGGKFKWSWSGTTAHGVLTVKTSGGGGGGGGGGTTTVATTTAATTTAATTTAATTTTGGGASCTTPTTTVNVGMREYAFDLDKTSVPAGCIQFVIKNNGQVVHNFNLIGVKAGAIISPGVSETWAVQLTAGSKNYTCDVPFHDSFGMNGSLTVT
jgi:uncharacterized cupredoxin-like copper-binding protein